MLRKKHLHPASGRLHLSMHPSCGWAYCRSPPFPDRSRLQDAHPSQEGRFAHNGQIVLVAVPFLTQCPKRDLHVVASK